ncbi:ExeA family protein [Pseudothauera lacus]|uniref:AAA+ ATPase domain-containing protein n=1 Tax=Pseudothauera lacus TaxID=2136175 RepID=A0A2T4IIL6_9RHOO|nr:ExeA family protein [Pseudothauera lacus]PTD97619.1 hypothetical protein C8261_02780 [Pseudothauera lacus]
MALRPPAAHLQLLGLSRHPFPTTPDAEAYFHTDLLEGELAEAVHCVLERKGFVVVTGEVGLGKSTLARRMIATLEAQGCAVALVLNTFLRERELLREINRDLGLPGSDDFGANLAGLNAFLLARQQEGHTTAILIDDAQNLCMESLELVRLLTNLETGQEKLVQIVLIAQPELVDTLERREIRQLTSRIVKHVRLQPLGPQEAMRYVDHRLSFAGAAGRITVTEAAHHCLFQHTRGNPRRMHIVLDRCLYGLVARHVRTVDAALVSAAARESGLQEGHLAPLRASAGWRRKAAYAALAASAVTALGATALAPGHEMAADTPPSSSAASTASAPDERLPPCLQARLDQSWRKAGGPLAAVDLASALAAADPAVDLLVLPPTLAAGAQDDPAVCLVDERHALWTHDWPEDRPLTYGKRSDGALRLQRALATLGHYHGELDGVIGIQTSRAIASFQTADGLPPTGFADPATLYMLTRAAKRHFTSKLDQQNG